MDKIEIENIFDWVGEITTKKSHPDSFSEKSWDKWNSYMIHRFISMNLGYIDIVNYVQKLNPQNKKQIYTIYREMIPKKKLWVKYIKNQNEKNNQELIEHIAKYFQCSLREADGYINLLPNQDIKNILWNMGGEEEEINKFIKKIKI